MLALLLPMLLVMTAGLVRGAATVARHRAETAADLGALAAAQRALDGSSPPCVEAARIVRENGASLRACRVVGLDVEVAAALQVRVGTLGTWAASARARAGPARR